MQKPHVKVPDSNLDQAGSQPASVHQPAPHAPIRRGATRREMLRTTSALICGVCSPVASSPAAEKIGQVAGRRRTGDSLYKQRAASDYAENMVPFGGRLTASPVNLLQSQAREAPWQFDVLIVGSGYGASIMAARIAPRLRPGCRLAVLERGREWIPGTFPDRLPDVLEQSRLTLMGSRKGQVNNPTGLFNVQQYEEITVLSGNGLGGSSLINASVAIRADQEIFEQAVWPEALRNRQVLEPYYELAEYELGAAREPWNASHKMIAQRKAWESLVASGASYESANLTLTRSPSHELPVLNRQKIRQRGCIDCGDCFTGCNVGAKNSLAMNYLPLARQAGGEIYTHTEVHHIAKSVQGGYQVYFTHLQENGSGGFHNCHGVTTARVVILGAGSVGSSEILMRSRALGLSVSPRLGCNWTGNGDALGFIRKCQLPTGIGGYSAYPTDRVAVGPTIQSNLTYPHRPLAGRVLIQDGAIARAYATALGTLMRDVDLDQTQALLGMGHDGANGRMYLDEHGTAQITWPELTDGRYRTLIRGEFERIAAALGGEYAFLKVFGDRLISVHPLGGCGMADDPSYGVVNDRGQVYDADHGGDSDVRTGQARVHDGLYVVDGAMLPTSLGCNPLLTISALAERCADHLAIEPALGGLFRSS